MLVNNLALDLVLLTSNVTKNKVIEAFKKLNLDQPVQSAGRKTIEKVRLR
jgi:hypothetical protein